VSIIVIKFFSIKHNSIMKNMFTLKNLLVSCFVILAVVSACLSANGQTNQALLAEFRHVFGGTGAVQTGGPWGYGYGHYHYNDGNIPTWPAKATRSPDPAAPNFGPDDFFTFVQGANDTIKIWWNFATPVFKINRITFYKNARPMTSCLILKKNWTTGILDTVAKYYNQNADVVDSIQVNLQINAVPAPNTVTDTIYIVNIQGPQGNPDFREIQLWRNNINICNPSAPGIVGGVGISPYSAGAGFPTNTIDLCPGFSAYMTTEAPNDTMWHYYQWQINNGTGWANIPGATNMGYVYQSNQGASFRVLDSCSGSAAATVSANTIQVVMNPPVTYIAPNSATGYLMDFQTAWQTSACLLPPYARDLPGAGWANIDPYGFHTWRIDTTSTGTSGWNNTSSGYGNPVGYPYGVTMGAANRSARAHTGSSAFDTLKTANLDLHLDMSSAAIAGTKALTFYYINQFPINYDTLRVLLSTNAGQTWAEIGKYDTAQMWKKRYLPITSNSPQTVLRFQATKTNPSGSQSDIGIDSVFIAPQCSGTPNPGKLRTHLSFAKTVSVCPGTELELTSLGSTIAGNLIFEWQHSYNLGTTFTPVNGGTGSTNLFFYTPPIYDTVMYRLAVKCGATGTVVYSDTIRVNMSTPAPEYAQLPYTQNFELWGNGCSTGDMVLAPGNVRNWTNFPSTGNNSWRRNLPDPTTTIWPTSNTVGWNSAGYPATPPGGGQYAARFHSTGAFTNSKGKFDLLFDGSGVAGDKELRFYYINTTGNDSLEVFYSVDSGGNFQKLAGYKNVPAWTQYTLQVPCSSSKCVVRFQGSAETGNQTDIGLDSVTIYPPCVGTPTAGIIKSTDTMPCPGETFTLSLQNFSVTGGLSFKWYCKPVSSPFVPQLCQLDTTKTFYTTNISVPTLFRVVVTCKYSGQKDSVDLILNVAPFYYCYCASTATTGTGSDIGNVNIKRLPAGTNLLNNGVAIPLNQNPLATGTYRDYRVGNPDGWLPLNPAPLSAYPTPIYHDTNYQLLVTHINSGSFVPATVTVWIDTDRNGLFDTDEILLRRTSSLTTTPPQRVDTLLSIPDSTPTGITGMRVMVEQGSNVNSVPCGTIGNGEVEDYLIEIRDHPCTGPASAGIAYTSDTAICANYTVTLTDTSHDKKQYGLRWVWQYSPDSNAWADVPGSQFRDTITPVVTSQTWYRLRMVCLMTFDTTYSNVVKVAINPAYACYCFSQAIGGAKDTSDIGGMSWTGSSGKGFYVPSVGPHLLNPWAVRARTDYTKDSVIHMYLDSTYQLLVFHTMSSATHADAKVTLFIDLNSDGLYNITSNPFTNERIWTGFTSSTYFTLVDSITVPTYGIPGVLTGMRLILNNNVAPNAPSDSACGPYNSGETEDYVVMLHNAANPWPPLGVNNINNVNNFYVYPNPSNGRFYVRFDATRPVDEATLTVTNVTGQQVVGKQILNPGKKMLEEINISGLAPGVYMVELKADNERFVRKLIVK
jgi:hypothetical protein